MVPTFDLTHLQSATALPPSGDRQRLTPAAIPTPICLLRLPSINSQLPVDTTPPGRGILQFSALPFQNAHPRLHLRHLRSSIESPVRRTGEMFNVAERKRVTSRARLHGIRTHLDGARLYLASSLDGIMPQASIPSTSRCTSTSTRPVVRFSPARKSCSRVPRPAYIGGGFPERVRQAVRTSETVIAALYRILADRAPPLVVPPDAGKTPNNM